MQRLVLVSLAAVAAVTVLVTARSPLLAQGATSTAGSAPPPAAKIAFISSQEILRNTPGYAVAESTYRKELQASQSEVQKLQQQLDSAVQAFDQQSIVLSPAARQTKQKDLQAMQQRMEQRGTQLQDRLQQREQDLLAPIQQRVNSVVQGLRAEGNYALILDADAPGSNIVAADPALDLTSKVVQRLRQNP